MKLYFNRKFFLIIVSLFLLLSMLFSFCSAGFNRPKLKKDKIVCIKFSRLFPNINKEGKLISYDTISDKVYYFNDQVLYQSAYTQNSKSVDGIILKTETKYCSFVYSAGSQTGLLFDSLTNRVNLRFRVDSFYNSSWLFKPYIDNIFKYSDSFLVSFIEKKDSGILMKTYHITDKKDSTKTGTCVLYFTDKLKNIKFSLSEYQDRLNNMKLFKVVVINNGRYLKDYKITLDTILTSHYMEEIPITNMEEVLFYFDIDKKTEYNKPT